jgi:hypothetical protein
MEAELEQLARVSEQVWAPVAASSERSHHSQDSALSRRNSIDRHGRRFAIPVVTLAPGHAVMGLRLLRQASKDGLARQFAPWENSIP